MNEHTRMIVPILTWWLAVQAIGILTLPIAVRCFRFLPSRGYILSKPLGLLLVTYILSLGASIHGLPNTRAGVWSAILILGVVSCVFAWSGRRSASGEGWLTESVSWLRIHWALVLAGEVLFFVTMAAGILFRAYFPELVPGEKQMEFAFINAILNSRWFPPHDPWLAGYSINYYYGGYVMVSLLIRMTNVSLDIGYNLASGMWIGLTLGTGFGVLYDLVTCAMRRDMVAPSTGNGQTMRAAIGWGLVGAILIGVVGNLQAALMLLYQVRWLPERWAQWLDLRWMTQESASGQWSGAAWWWYRASGVITDKDVLGNPIDLHTEFPSLSFIIGDLHPHVLSLPFLLLAIALAVNFCLAARQRVDEGVAGPLRSWGHVWRSFGHIFGLGAPMLGASAIALGGIAFVNTWDFATSIALVISAYGLGLALKRGLTVTVGLSTAIALSIISALCYGLYFWFHANLAPPVSGLLPNLFYPTRFSHFLVMFCIFLSPIIAFLGLLCYRRHDIVILALKLLIWLAVFALLVASGVTLGVYLKVGHLAASGAQITPAAYEFLSQLNLGQIASLAIRTRLTNPWSSAVLIMLVAVCLAIVVRELASGHRRDEQAATDLFGILLATLTFSLCLIVELVYINDYLGSRMNMVFKFYYQAWVLFAVTATYCLSRIFQSNVSVSFRFVILALMVLLLAGGLFYPLAAIPDRAGHFSSPPNLDAMAYLRGRLVEDIAAIDWIRKNVPPDAVVLEADGVSWSQGNDNRISIFTGNPTLLGWELHELQWRGGHFASITKDRRIAVEQIYRCETGEALLDLLQKWHVNYVVMGGVEKEKYHLTTENGACLQNNLRTVFEIGGLRIWATPK